MYESLLGRYVLLFLIFVCLGSDFLFRGTSFVARPMLVAWHSGGYLSITLTHLHSLLKTINTSI